VDDELSNDEEIPASERPFLALLTGERDEHPAPDRASDTH
jgi:hypothetical protein